MKEHFLVIEKIEEEFKHLLEKCNDLQTLQDIRVNFLGKKGKVTKLTKEMSLKVSIEERKEFGKLFNDLKNTIISNVESKEVILERIARQERIKEEKIDVSLAGNRSQIGKLHPLTLVKDEILTFFNRLGFVTVIGPEIESDYYNFEALNLPKGHPARNEQDSYYLSEDLLLRTQTSPMQIRVMEEHKLPIAIVSPGKVYRRDTVDATHSYFFHQVEGLLVDKDVSFSHLKGILTNFCHSFFGKNTKIRFRPDYFPFTEPSCEISIEYSNKKDGWLEILGAGIVNPLVLKKVGIDYEKYSGLAFGIGIERMAMLKYGIEDIRLFSQNDYDFNKQFC